MIVFANPGSIDPVAFTTMGVHAKPNTNDPIGHFGTGLKYAIATILRLGGRITLLNADYRFDFRTKKTLFRGQPVQSIVCLRIDLNNPAKRSYAFRLPYTTELGKHWEAWMAYRELMSNARDEDGDDPFKDDGLFFDKIIHRKWYQGNGTTIAVHLEAFEDIYENPERVKLHDDFAEMQPISLDRFDYYPGEASCHVYYKGLRVYTPKLPTCGTINIVGHEFLTEDRTLKYASIFDMEFAQALAAYGDEALLQSMTEMSDDYFEGTLPWDLVGNDPTDAFMRVVQHLYGKHNEHSIKTTTHSRMLSWYSKQLVAVPPECEAKKLIDRLDQLQDDLEKVESLELQQWIHDVEQYLQEQRTDTEDDDVIPF